MQKSIQILELSRVLEDKMAGSEGLGLQNGEGVLAVVADGRLISVYLHKAELRIGIDQFVIQVDFENDRQDTP